MAAATLEGSDMNTFGLIVLLAAAASALPADVPAAAGDVVSFRCAVNNEFNVVVKERKTPFYLCSSPDGDHFLMAASAEGLENNFETSLPKVEAIKLRELNAIIVGSPARPKRSPQFGGGFGGSGSSASANAGSFGGGGGFGSPFGGGGGIGGGGSYSNAAANSGSFGGGGGFGHPFFG